MNFDYQGLFGFDISLYQDANTTPQKIDFHKMRSYGTSFVIIKAGQWYWEDEDFSYNWAKSKEAGIPRASYFFGDNDDTGKRQAERYWEILQAGGWNGEVCIIDFENGSWSDWQNLYDFLVRIKELTKLPDDKIWIYTGYYYWKEHAPTDLVKLGWFKRHPLWIAWYTEFPENVQIPTPWTEAIMWQVGTPSIGLDVGVESKEIDFDKFNGGINKFSYYFGEVETPPDNGGNVTTYKGTIIVSALNIRPVPSYSNNTPYYSKPYGTTLEANEVQNGWWHLTKINNVDVDPTKDFWAYEGDAGGYIRTDEIIITPPPTSDITLNLSISLDQSGAVTKVFIDNKEYVEK